MSLLYGDVSVMTCKEYSVGGFIGHLFSFSCNYDFFLYNNVAMNSEKTICHVC